MKLLENYKIMKDRETTEIKKQNQKMILRILE